MGNSEVMAEVALGPGKKRPNRPYKVLELDLAGFPTRNNLNWGVVAQRRKGSVGFACATNTGQVT
jgi:hypothetical protein